MTISWGDILGAAYYDKYAYHYPVNEHYPVARFPVAGPAPFNTVAVVRGTGPGQAMWATGDMYRFRTTTPTSFRLIGFDPRLAPSYRPRQP